MLSEKAKKVKAEYMKKYRQRPEAKAKQQEYQTSYWERKAQELEAKRA